MAKGGTETLVRPEIVKPTPEKEAIIPARVANTYTGLRLDPTGEESAVFNGPLLPRSGGHFLILPRVMTKEQRPGIADHTHHFGVWEVHPNLDHSLRQLPSLEIAAIRGDGMSRQEGTTYNIEDIRITPLVDGTYATGVTAEQGGQPYPAYFLMESVPDGIRVISPMEIMTDLPSGKNVLMLGSGSAVYRPESWNDRLAVVTQAAQTLQWEIKKEIVFPTLEGVKGKTRIGLTGGERIPMANGNFRLILHVVDHIPLQNTEGDVATYHFRLAEFKLDTDGLPELVAVDPKPLLTYEEVTAVLDPEGKVIKPDDHKAVIYSVGGAIHQKGNEGGSKFFLFPVTYKDRLIGFFDPPLGLLQLPFEKVVT